MRRYSILPVIALLAAASCSVSVPDSFTDTDKTLECFPDYAGTIVPSNIAPLNFAVQASADKYVTVVESASGKEIIKGQKVQISQKKWEQIREGGSISFQTYTRKDGKWTRHPAFTVTTAEEIDPYISYRLIPPLIESYERLTINQRDLTSFDEKVIYENSLVQENDNGQCINCHHFRNYRTDNMQFHARQYMGCTLLVTDGNMKKINLKTDSTLSAGVYPAWNPVYDYIAYSTNKTHQSLHTSDQNHIEVLDVESDLILYDVKGNAVSMIENGKNDFECFPAWTPDGKTLYYVSAHFEPDSTSARPHDDQVFLSSRDIRYNLYRKAFNPENRSWGESELVFNAESLGQSVTLPRVSPDGRYLMMAIAEYGIFHIWHRTSQLAMIDLQTGEFRELDELNSPDVESYHSWSSNGHWIIFSTRREDREYTRLYISHFNPDGTFSKPFALPQKDPSFNKDFLLSFNIPEFMVEPVSIPAREFASFIKENETGTVSFEHKHTF